VAACSEVWRHQRRSENVAAAKIIKCEAAMACMHLAAGRKYGGENLAKYRNSGETINGE